MKMDGECFFLNNEKREKSLGMATANSLFLSTENTENAENL